MGTESLPGAEALDSCGEALFEETGAFGGYASQVVWYRCGCQHQDEGNGGETDAGGGR